MLSSSVGVLASPPPNDNFANRIVLASNSNTFEATLAEASEEPFEFEYHPPLGPVGTLWWSWTASDSTPVVLQTLEFSQLSNNFNYPTINIYLSNDLSRGYPSYTNLSVRIVAWVQLANIPIPASLTFTSTPGSTYWIQLTGNHDLVGKFALVATNTPIVVQQPKTQTVSLHAAALFSVVADGVRPFGYQWRFNGSDLAGELTPMLAQTNVTTDQAGAYSVVLSNATGMATSQVAYLYVNSEPSPPRLAALWPPFSNSFAFSLSGETGRSSRVETSTNLIEWAEEKVSPLGSSSLNGLPFLTSVVFNTNGVAPFSIPASPGRKFVRALHYSPSNEVCNLNLKQLRFAKDLFAFEHGRSGSDAISDMDLAQYFKGDYLRARNCPLGGYILPNYIQMPPICTNLGHILEEPR